MAKSSKGKAARSKGPQPVSVVMLWKEGEAFDGNILTESFVLRTGASRALRKVRHALASNGFAVEVIADVANLRAFRAVSPNGVVFLGKITRRHFVTDVTEMVTNIVAA